MVETLITAAEQERCCPSLEAWPSGSNNVAMGFGLERQSDGKWDIANPGADGESGVIRIGTEGVHTRVVLAGTVEGSNDPRTTLLNKRTCSGRVPLGSQTKADQ